MLSANFKPKRTAAASRGFLATAGFLVLIANSNSREKDMPTFLRNHTEMAKMSHG